MRRFVTLAALALVLVGPRSGAAPVPKETPQASIDGKYTLVSVSLPEDRQMAANPGGFPAGGPGGAIRIRTSAAATYMAGPATITKNTITLEGRGIANPFTGAGPTTMEYALNATKTPMTIDITSVNLRGAKGKPQLGLVEVVGDRLVVAVAAAGEDRPKNTEENDNVTVYYFQKAPPPPKTEFRIVAMAVGKEAEAEKELNKLAGEGFELVSTTAAAPDAKSAPTTVHFVLKRIVK